MDTFARRERKVLAWTLGLRLAVVVGIAGLAAVIAAWRGVEAASAAALLVLVVGVGAWVAVAWPWHLHWRSARDPMHQARLLEARDPALRGRLVTAVGREHGAVGAESPALLGRVARRALAGAVVHDPIIVHPGTGVRRWGVLAVLSWLVASGALFSAPGGATGVVAWWVGDEAALAAIESGSGVASGASGRVGDLTLRYVYPDYTGLPPYEVVNGAGEAHGPPGTRVEVVARSATPVEGAALVAYDHPAYEATVEEGRRLSASFVIEPRDGAYRLELRSDGELRTTPSYPIVVEPDLAPEVTLAIDDTVLEVPVNEPLVLPWVATDDYGVERVEVWMEGRVSGAPLSRPRERRASLSEVLMRRPDEMGMRPGETYQLSIAAWDNDTISGSKMGRSAQIRVVVLDEDGVARLDEGKRLELLDLLVELLAVHLEDRWPPGRPSGAFARWGETIESSYRPLASFVDAFRGRRGLAPEFEPVEDALNDGTRLIRYSQISFVPASTDVPNLASVEALSDFRDVAIESVEIAALHVDALLRNAALKRLYEESDLLAIDAYEAKMAAERSDADATSMTMLTESLAERMEELRLLGERMRDGALPRLVEYRSSEVEGMLEEAQGAAQAGQMEEAQELMQRVSERTQEFADAIRDEFERAAEQQKKAKDKADDVIKALEELEARQGALAQQVASIREQDGAGYQQAVAELWKRIEQQAERVRDESTRLREDLSAASGPFNLVTNVEEAVDLAGRALSAVQARDLAGAIAQVDDVDFQWQLIERRFRALAAIRAAPPMEARVSAAQREVRALADLLEQLRRKENAGDPALREQVSQLEAAQHVLESDLASTAQDAQRAAEEMPVTPRHLDEALDGAAQRMDEAARQLGRGAGMQAEGSQQAAGQHLRDAIDAFKKAQQGGGAQGDELQPGGKGDEEGSDQEEDGEERDGEGVKPLALPDPESFRTPEAYRQALLRGMEGDVPEEYRALKRRYYEELVHQ